MSKIRCILIIALCSILLLSQSQSEISDFIEDSIKIEGIDTMECHYVIYAVSQINETRYKIVSRIIPYFCKNQIEIAQVLYVHLHKQLPMDDMSDIHIYLGCSDYTSSFNWDRSIYIVDEFCGSCYERDTTIQNIWRKKNQEQEKLEGALVGIFFFYRKNNRVLSLGDFLKNRLSNSIVFSIQIRKTIPIMARAKRLKQVKQEIKWLLANKHNSLFQGNIYYQYKSMYFIRGYYVEAPDKQIQGWINKKYLKEAVYDMALLAILT